MHSRHVIGGHVYRIVPTGPENGYLPGRALIQRRYPELDGLWCDVGDPHPNAVIAYRALCAHVAEVTP